MTEADLALRERLERWVHRYNQPEFVATDPIAIPHLFADGRDIALAGLLTATLAWGNRATILASAQRLLALMDHAPYEFIRDHTAADRARLKGFVHRTFNGADLAAFVAALQRIEHDLGGLEAVVCNAVRSEDADVSSGLIALHAALTGSPRFPARTHKHVADIRRGSAAKRLNMFLRWMVRRDAAGVDFGLWTHIRPDQLLCPLDVHTGRVARSLGLLHRTQNDFRAVIELTTRLKDFDPTDPVKYDLALFGLGASGEWDY